MDFQQQIEAVRNRIFYSKVLPMVKDFADAQDVMQQAELNAFKHQQDFRGESQFATWFTRIAINEAKMHLRKRYLARQREGIDTSLDAALEFGLDYADSKAESPERFAMRNEFIKIVEDASECLTPAEKEVFLLCIIDGETTRSVSVLLEKSKSTVKKHLWMASKKIRALRVADRIRDYGLALK